MTITWNRGVWSLLLDGWIRNTTRFSEGTARLAESELSTIVRSPAVERAATSQGAAMISTEGEADDTNSWKPRCWKRPRWRRRRASTRESARGLRRIAER